MVGKICEKGVEPGVKEGVMDGESGDRG